jgi:hypothetical protein
VTVVWPVGVVTDRLTVTALAWWEMRVCAAPALAAAAVDVADEDAGAGALGAEALEPEPPVEPEEVCPRSATNHTATNSANATRTIWKGREIWVICYALCRQVGRES